MRANRIESSTRGRSLAVRALAAKVLFAVMLAAAASPATAQSITGGSVAGMVRDEAGLPVFDVIVTLEPVLGGTARADTTLRDGQFTINTVPPGEYDVLAERLGFRPQRVRGVVVRPGRTVRVALEIGEVSGTPESVDVVQWDGGVTSALPAGLTVGAGRELFLGLPYAERTLDEVARISSFMAPDLGTRGLPGSYTQFVVDGVPVRGSRHPLLGAGPARTAALRLSAFEEVQVVLDDPDVEYAGFAGAAVAAHGRRGGRDLHVDAFVNGSAGALRTSRFYDPSSVGGADVQGGLALSGAIAADTAHFAVGFEVGRQEVPHPAVLDPEVSAAAATVLQRLGDAGTLLAEPFGSKLETIAGFGSLDWQITDLHRLTTRVDVARVGSAETGLPGGGLMATSSGTDVMLAGALTSRIGESSSLEFRFGLDRTSRTYEAAEAGAVAWTGVANGSLGFGTDPMLPGSFTSSSLFLSETFLTRSDAHQLKLGAGAWLARHDRSVVWGAPAFYFPAGPMVPGSGGYATEPGPVPETSFSTRQFFGFVQDEWTVSNEAQLVFGVRAEYERLPLEDIPVDPEWRALAGMDNNQIPEQPDPKLSPRFGFNWDVGGAGRYFLRGSAGIYYETVDPDILAEVIGEIGDRRVGIRTGAVSGWPEAPTGGSLTESAMTSILTPRFRAPRSERGSLGLGIAAGGGLAVSVMGTVGRTTGLPRRIDLNRLPGTVALDQDGRPVPGVLVKDGSLLYGQPGSNRRFTAYDHVYGIDADGTSDHVGVTAGIERSVAEGPTFFARYTWSRTTDDWLNAGLAPRALQLSPFPEDEAWQEGTADLDVPHRLVAGVEVPVPGTPVRVAGFYGFSSGRAFTPGFPPGVDPNGDGVFGNDPAAPGAATSALGSAWPCLRDTVDGFVERNACRDPDAHRLDLRVAADLHVGESGTLAVFVDALNVVEPDLAIRDHALYRLDPNASLTSDGVGRITLPLVVNDGFGEPVIRLSSGRVVRFGLQLRY